MSMRFETLESVAPAQGPLPSTPTGPGSVRLRLDPRPVAIHALSVPATGFTGDFYAFVDSPTGLWFAMGDLTGHGLASAVLMAIVREELERIIDSCTSADPAEVVACLDRMMRVELPSNKFASLVVGKVAPDGSLQLVNAGHCHPLLIRKDGRVERVDPHGPVVGISPLPCWGSGALHLEKGDRLVLYTDGLIEAASEAGEELGLDRVAAIASTTPAEELPDRLLRTLRDFSPMPQQDDVTIVVLAR